MRCCMGISMADILIVEDNKEISTLLRDFVTAEGYSAKIAASGESAMAFLEKESARLLVLDIMLPGMDGFALCRKIREKGNVPIIIISAKSEKDDKLKGLLAGADDYMEKPFDIDILLAKINGIFKRRYAENILCAGDIRLDKAKCEVSKSGQLLSMTGKEFSLLLYLMENSGHTLKKERIFNQIWGFDSFSEPQTLTVHIKWLREKIEDNPKEPKHILTVWGTGYRFE